MPRSNKKLRIIKRNARCCINFDTEKYAKPCCAHLSAAAAVGFGIEKALVSDLPHSHAFHLTRYMQHTRRQARK